MARAKSFFDLIWSKKLKFLFVYFLVFLFTYLFLVAIDFVPEPKSAVDESESATEMMAEISDTETVSETELTTVNVIEENALPIELRIPRLDKSISVLNPNSRNIADLDAALLDGVVRHPDSALLGQTGNVFILGHSSYLPTVLNHNFQAFNGIQNLEWGDVIEVVSEDFVFTYRVEKVFKARADELTVPIAVDEKMLTIATCNSFGSVDDRYIVEAKQVSVEARKA